MKKLSIVIPVYFNEGEILPLYADLKEKVLSKINCQYEIVMVDDGSKDKSYEEMCSLAKIDYNIKLVKLSRNFGEHAATLAGMAQCTGDCAVRKAADMQEPSELILDLIGEYKKGSKVVIANRADREEPFAQKLFSGIYCWIMRKCALSNMPKGGFDSYLIDRQVIDMVVSMNEKNTPLTEQILWCGFEPVSVDYVRLKREIGKSRWTFAKKFKLLIDSLLGFSYIPIRFISVVGFVSAAVAGVWLVVELARKIFGITTVEGFTTIVMVLLGAFGLIMLSLGVIGEYVWRMFDAIRNRPPYIIDETKNMKNAIDKETDNAPSINVAKSSSEMKKSITKEKADNN